MIRVSRVAMTILLLAPVGCHRHRDVAAVGPSTETQPVDGALRVEPGNALRITLGAEVDDQVSIAASSVVLRHATGSVPVTVDYDPTTRTASIQPQQSLAGGAVYVAEVRDANGSGWEYAWQFATRDDRTWQSIPAVAGTRWVRWPNGQVHAYWTDATAQVQTGILPPGSAALIPGGAVGAGSLLTVGFDPSGFETVLLQTTGVDAYYRLPGGSWNGPLPSPTVPSGGITNGYSGARTAPDGTVAFFTYWMFYHSGGTDVVPFSPTAGWLPSSGWSYSQFPPSPQFRSAVDWISTTRLVRVSASVVGAEWQVQSAFVPNQPLATAGVADDVLPTAVANATGQALFAWLVVTGDTWSLHATAPASESVIVVPTSLGSGTGWASTRAPTVALGPSGHAVVVLPIGSDLRVWRYSPGTGWSSGATFPSGPYYASLPPDNPGFGVGIDADGDVLLVHQRDDAVVAYRGYVGLAWDDAERIESVQGASTAGRFEVLHDPVAGDLVTWSSGAALGTYRRL